MNQAFGSESDYYVDSEYKSSIDVRRFPKTPNGRLKTEVFGHEDNRKWEGQSYCFSAAKLKQFIELKKQTEETNYLDLDNHVCTHPKVEENSYDRWINKYMEYILHISTTPDDIVNPNLLAVALAKKAYANRKLAKLLSSTVAAMKHRWIWEIPLKLREDLEEKYGNAPVEEGSITWNYMDSPGWEQQQGQRGRTGEIGKEFQEISPLECSVNEQVQEAQNRKRRLCRHFLKGYCKRGNTCDFLHDSSIFCPDLQKVFLGGLPSHITESSLRQKMAEQGFNVINKPKVLRGFTPQVCLGSVEEAQRLIKKGKLVIDGSQVDVRPYEAFVKDTPEKKLPDDTKRSVFLGGLPNGTTGKDIKEELKKLDVKVVNHPLIKAGFTPQVMLGNAEQAEKLVNLKKVRIRNTLVDVRPYVNSRVGSNRSGKN